MEVGCISQHLDGAEMEHGWSWAASRATWRRDATWMEVRCKYQDLGGGETWCGWRRCNYKKVNGGEMGHGWRWDAHLETWIGFRWDLAGTEMQQDGVEGRLGWIWNANLGTWMEMRPDLNGGEMRIYGMDGVRQVMDGGKMHILRPGWGEMKIAWPGRRWDAMWM